MITLINFELGNLYRPFDCIDLGLEQSDHINHIDHHINCLQCTE